MTRDDLLAMLLKTTPAIYAREDHLIEHQPMAFTWSPAEGLQVIALVMHKDSFREAFVGMVRDGATAVAHVNEAWTTAHPLSLAEVDAVRRRGGVSTLPPDDRKEVLVIATADRDGVTGCSLTLTRTPGSSVTLGPPRPILAPYVRVFTDLPWPAAPEGGRP
jgi:hypothetical protein